MSLRLTVNLVAFALLAVVLGVWAVNHVVTIDALTHPYTVTADFSTSPGLPARSQVTYLGKPVGSVGKVELHGAGIRAWLKLDNGVRLPAAVSASLQRQSAVGEPFVELAPLPGSRPGDGPRLAGGDNIPLQHTSTSLSYSVLFTALDQLVGAINPGDLKSLLHQLALGVEGRSDSIRELIVNSNQIAADYASRGALLDQLLRQLSETSKTIASHSEAIGQATDNLAALTDTLNQSSQRIDALLDNGPSLLSVLSRILNPSEGQLGCSLDALGAVAQALGDPATTKAVDHLISLSPNFSIVLQGIRDPQKYARGVLGFAIGGSPSRTYAQPDPQPKLAPPVHCLAAPKPGPPRAPIAPSPSSQGGAPGAVGQAGRVPGPPVPSGKGLPASGSEKKQSHHGGLAVAAVVGLLVAAVVALMVFFAARRRRVRP